MKVFISGSMSLKNLPKKIKDILLRIINNNEKVLVGDAKGIDFLVQKFFSEKNYKNVSVYTIFSIPRNIANSDFTIINIIPSNIKNNRAKQMYKDERMVKDADYCIVIWDGKSKGSYNNILNALKLNKKIKVFLTNENKFLTENEVNNIKDFFHKNNGYSAQEIVDEIGCFKNIKEFYTFLVNNNIVIKENKKYIPINEYKKYFFYEGKYNNLKFYESFLKILKRLCRDKVKQPTLPID